MPCHACEAGVSVSVSVSGLLVRKYKSREAFPLKWSRITPLILSSRIYSISPFQLLYTRISTSSQPIMVNSTQIIAALAGTYKLLNTSR